MVRHTIALDDKVSYLRDPLARAGFQVVGMADGLGRADAAVTSGLSQDLTGAQDIKTNAPVINATGKSPEEVIAALKERLS